MKRRDLLKDMGCNCGDLYGCSSCNRAVDDGGIVILRLFGKAESGLDRHRSGRSLSRQKPAHVVVGGRLILVVPVYDD